MTKINIENDFNTEVTFSSDVRNVTDLRVTQLKWSKFLEVISNPKLGEKGSNGVFIGGKVVDRRNNENVVNRSMVTIDIDDIPIDFPNIFEHIKNKGLNTFAIYSTHNHTKDNPRYRLVIPFREAVELSKDEYKVLVQILSKAYEIPFYDKQSESLSLAMNMPTVSKSNEDKYEFYHYEGKPLDVESMKGALKSEIRKIKLDFANTYEQRLTEYREIARNGSSSSKGKNSRNVGLTELMGHLLNKNVDEILMYELLRGWWHYHRKDNEKSYKENQREFYDSFKSILKLNLKSKYRGQGGCLSIE